MATMPVRAGAVSQDWSTDPAGDEGKNPRKKRSLHSAEKILERVPELNQWEKILQGKQKKNRFSSPLTTKNGVEPCPTQHVKGYQNDACRGFSGGHKEHEGEGLVELTSMREGAGTRDRKFRSQNIQKLRVPLHLPNDLGVDVDLDLMKPPTPASIARGMHFQPTVPMTSLQPLHGMGALQKFRNLFSPGHLDQSPYMLADSVSSLVIGPCDTEKRIPRQSVEDRVEFIFQVPRVIPNPQPTTLESEQSKKMTPTTQVTKGLALPLDTPKVVPSCQGRGGLEAPPLGGYFKKEASELPDRVRAQRLEFDIILSSKKALMEEMERSLCGVEKDLVNLASRLAI